MNKEGFDNDDPQGEDNHFKHTFMGQTYPYHKNVYALPILAPCRKGHRWV